jgi:hypothetical protein
VVRTPPAYPPLAAVPAGGGQQPVLLGLGDQFPLAVVELSQLQIWVDEHLGLRIARSVDDSILIR